MKCDKTLSFIDNFILIQPKCFDRFKIRQELEDFVEKNNVEVGFDHLNMFFYHIKLFGIDYGTIRIKIAFSYGKNRDLLNRTYTFPYIQLFGYSDIVHPHIYNQDKRFCCGGFVLKAIQRYDFFAAYDLCNILLRNYNQHSPYNNRRTCEANIKNVCEICGAHIDNYYICNLCIGSSSDIIYYITSQWTSC